MLISVSLGTDATTSSLLMHPVLDPFLLNVLPRSLVPVAAYITIVAVAAWFLSAYVYRWLLLVLQEPLQKVRTD